jgi:DmsE family decaheme c-type cytochrome
MHRAKGTIAVDFAAFLAALGWFPALQAVLFFWTLLVLAPPAHAWDQRSESSAFDRNPRAAIMDAAALREYAGQIGLQSRKLAASDSPHPHFDDAVDYGALREYAREVTIAQSSAVTDGYSGWVHPHFGHIEAVALQDSAVAEQVHSERFFDISERHAHFADPDIAALRDYAQDLTGNSPRSSNATLQFARSDNAFDALRDMLRKQGQPAPAPDTGPRRPVPPPAVTRDPSFVNAHRVGSQTCLYCHAVQADSFGRTLMGRIGKTQPAKFDCENCHGPGSAHLQAVGCSACHGEGGISRRPGFPSLIGQDPQYLTRAMRAYVDGQRKHELMRLVLSGLSEAELHDIASWYARQPAERAKTPPVGDASAGRASTGLCAECHGDLGISVAPVFPSLAGQDAQYLADAIQAYKIGTRTKAIPCAGCHGEGGISRKPGTPSLTGMSPQYLLTAMKDYVSGERKHGVMRVLLSGVDDTQLNSFAQYYSRQAPTKAQTPSVGDPSAGKTAAVLCAGCHGEANGSVSEALPSLAGQDARYLDAAIKAYRSGARHKMVACAACHGERGITSKPGIPSLAGLAPQYVVAVMKDYAAGKRKSAVMNALLADVGESELNDIAQFYARQVPARAATPTLGDAATGKNASATCAGCHGPQGVSANPAFPSLAGQDARYLADTLRSYKDGSRDNPIMKGMVAALDETAINNIAGYYASLPPAQPAPPAGAQPPGGPREPVVSANKLLASLDDRAADDIAAYFASLVPARSGQPNAAGSRGEREPVVVRNGLVASLDERTARDVATYYASLTPSRPPSANRAPGGPEPALVNYTRPADGSSPGGIVSFRRNDPSRKVETNNAICLGCHERGERTYWMGSTHEIRAVACTECHTVMRPVSRKAALKTEIEVDTCFQCHKDRRAQILRSSHMPLREGKMTCSNCHNPHGSATEALLRENSINDTCYNCHAEKRGPFLFEHAPVRENCLSCHDPHGSNNEYMLKISRPRLCAECHGFGHSALTNGPASVETFGRSCQNCHVAIHGSNSPSGALLQR